MFIVEAKNKITCAFIVKIKMCDYNSTDRSLIISEYFTNSKSIHLTQVAWRRVKKSKKAPDAKTIRKIVERFINGENALQRKGGITYVATEETIQKVKDHVLGTERPSIRKSAPQLGLSTTTFHRILIKNLNYKAYKIQVGQPLSDRHKEQRVFFAKLMLERLEKKEIDFNKIWFSDECHFHLDGYVNRQNYCFWGSEPPHVLVQKPLHSQRVTVWCGISGKGIIGPFFFDQTVNGDRYLEMLKEQVIPTIRRKRCLSNFWFMQDGAPPHWKKGITEFLKTHFQKRIISIKSSCTDWPSFSPDLNPCDFFLWGYLKDNIYKNPITDVDSLKNMIQNEILKIDINLCGRVISSFEKRLQTIIQSNGGHIELR